MAPPKLNEARSKKKSKKTEKVEEVMIDPDLPVKPDDQLTLTAEELDELYGNIFYAREPPAPHARVIYNNRRKKFIPEPDKSKFITLMSLTCALFHCESEEAKVQNENELCRTMEEFARDESEYEIEEEEEKEVKKVEENKNFPDVEGEVEIGEGADEGSSGGEEEGALDDLSGREEELGELKDDDEKSITTIVQSKIDDVESKKDTADDVSDVESACSSITNFTPVKNLCTVIKLQNKFNFFDRTVQTKVISSQFQVTQTLATKKKGFQTTVLVSATHGMYNDDFEREQKKKEEEMKKKMAAHVTKKSAGSKNMGVVHSAKALDLLKLSKIVEKVINYYETEAIAQDFRYYEDPSDQFRDKGEGTLMLMWTMVYEKKKKLIVTDISWNPSYFDMFAITLSIPQCFVTLSEDPDIGYVCLWLLENTAYPEFVTEMHCGATCLSFSQHHTNCLAVGLRDGSLAVFNLSLLTREPQYKSDLDEIRHFSSVKQIVWCKDMPTGEMNFLSVSDDGTVCQWILLQNELHKIVKILLTVEPDIELGGLNQPYHAMGTAIAFNPVNEAVYMIGTAEGYIYKCNMEWSGFQQRIRGHRMAVNRIDYNNYDANIFITCSDDFMIKIWEDDAEEPLILMNLMTALADVRWSPFSSTVFCVITVDCRAMFYDMDVSLRNPVCNQLIHPPSEYRLSRLVFNKLMPIVLIGSTKCTVITYKLSPALRTTLKSPKKGVQVSPEELEYEKLQNVLSVIRKQLDRPAET